MLIFLCFCMVFLGGATKHQKWRRGAPPAFLSAFKSLFFFVIFVAHLKAVPLCIKNEAERRRAFFCRFCGAFKAVLRCIKNEAE